MNEYNKINNNTINTAVIVDNANLLVIGCVLAMCCCCCCDEIRGTMIDRLNKKKSKEWGFKSIGLRNARI